MLRAQVSLTIAKLQVEAQLRASPIGFRRLQLIHFKGYMAVIVPVLGNGQRKAQKFADFEQSISNLYRKAAADTRSVTLRNR